MPTPVGLLQQNEECAQEMLGWPNKHIFDSRNLNELPDLLVMWFCWYYV